jgi:hypothetical protein
METGAKTPKFADHTSMISYKPFITRLGCLVERMFTLAQNGAIHEHITLSVPNEHSRSRSAQPKRPDEQSL